MRFSTGKKRQWCPIPWRRDLRRELRETGYACRAVWGTPRSSKWPSPCSMAVALGRTVTSVPVPFAQTMSVAGRGRTCPAAPRPSVPGVLSSCANGVDARTTVRRLWRSVPTVGRCPQCMRSMCFGGPNPRAVTARMSLSPTPPSLRKSPPLKASRSVAVAPRRQILRTVSCGT
jgi:hypothetical protein